MSARNRVWRGLNARVELTPQGQRLSGRAASRWRHPWEIDCDFLDGQWRGTVQPGFVNGRPAFIDMPAAWLRAQVANGSADERDFGINPLTGKPYFSAWVFNNEAPTSKKDDVPGEGGPVRLTNEPAPYLVLNAWRNPLASRGISFTTEGETIYGPGENYPQFFASIGVRPRAPGGGSNSIPQDPLRTRELRAMDVVLTRPRPGSALTVTELNPLSDNFTHQLDTTYTTAYYDAQGGRTKLTAVSKYVPLENETIESPFLRLPMNAGDPQMDQLKVATIWMVSPAGYTEADVPDQTWEPYVQHFVFWNLWHAVRFTPPGPKLPPLKLVTGLGLGILDYLANAFLSPINSAMDEANTFLNQSDMRGQFWST